MNIQHIEMELIRNDIDDMYSVITYISSLETSGYLIHAIHPTVSFVIVECHKYLYSKKFKIKFF